MLIVDVKRVPYSATSFLLTTGATYWNPNMFFGSRSCTYLLDRSCGSVVNTSAASTFFWSSSVYAEMPASGTKSKPFTP